MCASCQGTILLFHCKLHTFHIGFRDHMKNLLFGNIRIDDFVISLVTPKPIRLNNLLKLNHFAKLLIWVLVWAGVWVHGCGNFLSWV